MGTQLVLIFYQLVGTSEVTPDIWFRSHKKPIYGVFFLGTRKCPQ